MTRELAVSKAIVQLQQLSNIEFDSSKSFYQQLPMYAQVDNVNISIFISTLQSLLNSPNCTEERAELELAHAVLAKFCLVSEVLDQNFPNASNDYTIFKDIFQIINSNDYTHFLTIGNIADTGEQGCDRSEMHNEGHEISVGGRLSVPLGYLSLTDSLEISDVTIVGSDKYAAAAGHFDIKSADVRD